MKINGVDFEIDFTDADVIERIDKGCKKIDEEAEKLKKIEDISQAEGIRQECKIIKEFVDYVLGDGSSKKIFGDKNSLMKHIEVFEDIVETRDEQVRIIQEKISKYSPERIQR